MGIFNTGEEFSGYVVPLNPVCRLVERDTMTADERGLFRNETPDYTIRRYLYGIKSIFT